MSARASRESPSAISANMSMLKARLFMVVPFMVVTFNCAPRGCPIKKRSILIGRGRRGITTSLSSPADCVSSGMVTRLSGTPRELTRAIEPTRPRCRHRIANAGSGLRGGSAMNAGLPSRRGLLSASGSPGGAPAMERRGDLACAAHTRFARVPPSDERI